MKRQQLTAYRLYRQQHKVSNSIIQASLCIALEFFQARSLGQAFGRRYQVIEFDEVVVEALRPQIETASFELMNERGIE